MSKVFDEIREEKAIRIAKLESMFVKYLKAETKRSQIEKTDIRYEKYKNFNIMFERGSHERKS